MRYRRLGTLSVVSVLFGFVTSSCIADGDSTNNPLFTGAPEAGNHGGGSAGASDTPQAGAGGEIEEVSAGTSATGNGAGGSGGTTEPPSEGGEGGSEVGFAGQGANGGSANTGATGGTQAHGGVANDGGVPGAGGNAEGGGPGSEPPPPLTICLRLADPYSKSLAVTQGYRAATTRDCRIAWVTRLYLDLDQEHSFLNGLIRWNAELWGCSVTPPENFGLLYTEVPLTSADAEVLIDFYMEAAIPALELSSEEIEAMRAWLEHLADRVITRQTEEFTDSHCETGAGGDGGAP